MKHRSLLTLSVVLLLLMILSMTACGNILVPNDPASQTSDDADGGDANKTDPSKIVSDKVTLRIYHEGSGVVQNAEGESFAYESSNDFITDGDMEIYSHEYFPSLFVGDFGALDRNYSEVTVHYSDSLGLTTDGGKARITGWFDGAAGEPTWSDVTCTGDGKIEIKYKDAGDKVTVSGDNASYKILVDLKNNYPLHRHINSFILEGQTTGSVVLEEETDGWYLSGIEDEVTLYYYIVIRDKNDYPGQRKVFLTAPEDGGRIRLEDHMPEAKQN